MAVYVNPFRQLRGEMDRLLNGFISPTFDDLFPGVLRGQPAVNLWDQTDDLMLEMELPGAKSEQINISVAGEELSINLERPDLAEEGVTYHRRERPIGSFTRIVQLPCAVDAQRVEADLSKGVLTVKLPKAETVKPRKINVTST